MTNHQSTIQELFIRKGYFPNSIITKRELLLLLNSLMIYTNGSNIGQSQNDTKKQSFFDQILLNQLWTQTQQKVQNKNKVRTIEAIKTIVDAIQILANRLNQIQNQIQTLSQNLIKQKQNLNILKEEKINLQISEKEDDYIQFKKDLQVLLRPFHINFSQVSVIKRKDSIKKRNAFQYQLDEQQKEKVTQIQQRKKMMSLQDMQMYLELLAVNVQQSSAQQFKCSRYFFIFLAVLELTVCLYKYNFVNMLLLVLGFMAFQNQTYKEHLVKIAIGFSIFTVGLDLVWIILYSERYLNATISNSPGLRHELKPVFQYIWLITVLQICVKLILVYFLIQYHRICQKYIEQKMQDLAEDLSRQDRAR